MKCPNCNFEVAENTKFCPECGANLSSIPIIKQPTQNSGNEEVKSIKKKTKLMVILIISILGVCAIVLLFLHLLFTSCLFGKHDYSELTLGEAPTCVKDGYEYQYCLECGKTLHTLVLKKTDHLFTAGECGTERTCTFCGEKKTFQHEEVYYGDKVGTCHHCGKSKCSISTPTAPITVHTYDNFDNIEETIVVTDIKKELNDSSLEITFTVERIFHKRGSNHSAAGEFGWKLYNANGAVIESGIKRSGAIAMGEKSVCTLTFYDFELDDYEDYRLEILNVS